MYLILRHVITSNNMPFHSLSLLLGCKITHFFSFIGHKSEKNGEKEEKVGIFM